jgi:hypothetical protein
MQEREIGTVSPATGTRFLYLAHAHVTMLNGGGTFLLPFKILPGTGTISDCINDERYKK